MTVVRARNDETRGLQRCKPRCDRRRFLCPGDGQKAVQNLRMAKPETGVRRNRRNRFRSLFICVDLRFQVDFPSSRCAALSLWSWSESAESAQAADGRAFVFLGLPRGRSAVESGTGTACGARNILRSFHLTKSEKCIEYSAGCKTTSDNLDASRHCDREIEQFSIGICCAAICSLTIWMAGKEIDSKENYRERCNSRARGFIMTISGSQATKSI